MKIYVDDSLKDKFYSIFPRGNIDGIPLDDINKKLRRCGIYARSRFPGSSIEIDSLENYPRACLRGCEDNTCRNLHGDVAEDIEALYYKCFEQFYDELYYLTSRRRTRRGIDKMRTNLFITPFKYYACNAIINDWKSYIGNSGATYIQERLRETSFMRKILLPGYLG